MRWIKHPSSFCRSAAMTDVRETLGPAGYGAVWLLLERIAESWDGTTEPELRISIKEWKKTCGISAKKLQELLDILKNYEIIFAENEQNRLSLKAPILVDLLDESTRKARKNSGIVPEPLRNDSGLQTDKEAEIDKDKNKTHPPPPNIRLRLLPVLKRHGIEPDSERGRRIIRYTERKRPENPGGYLEKILQTKPYFDPEPDGAFEPPSNGPIGIGDAIKRLGFNPDG